MTAATPPPAPDEEVLLEAATGAFRERDTFGRIRPAPAWEDLDAAGRAALFRRQLVARVIERALDPRGLSTTARAVLRRIVDLRQLE